MKRTVASIISAALIVSLVALLVSCGGESATVSDTVSDTVQADTETTPVTEPEKTYDFEGADFTIFTFADTTLSPLSFYGGNEMSGDIFNDSIYERNSTVESKYNINLTYFGYDDTDSLGKNMAQTLSSSILAGDDTYKLIVTHMHKSTVQLLNAGLLRNWLSLPEIDWSKEWYSASINDNLTINGYLPCAVSDFNITSQIFTFAMIFSKEMVEDLALESPYKLVRDGKWTLDGFAEYIKAAAADVDGNGTFDENDSYGYAGNTGVSMQGFFYGAGLKFVELDNQGKPEIQLESQHFYDFYEKLYRIYTEDNATFLIPKVDMICPISFDSNRIMIISLRFRFLDEYRNTADFGIIPYPKYDDAQDDYLSYVDGRGCHTMIPVTNQQDELTAAVFDGLSRESHNTVVPVYYEKVLESKYSRDEDSLEMLDIIFRNRIFDFGYVYRTDPLTFACYNIYSSKSEPASYLASKIPAAQAHFDAVYDSYMQFGG